MLILKSQILLGGQVYHRELIKSCISVSLTVVYCMGKLTAGYLSMANNG